MGDIERITRLSVETQHILHAVGLGGDDPRQTVSVVHLGPVLEVRGLRERG